MATHKAITQLKPSGPLSLSQIGPHTINDDQLMVRMEAIALNPGEQKAMDNGWLSSYPWVPGADLCGTIVQVGSLVDNFDIGDRIISLQMSSESSLGNKGAALQDYAVVDADLSAKVPCHYSATEASTLPVVLLTVFAALYTFHWGIPIPDNTVHKEPILVWGGGSSVGQAAITLLKLTGYANIITTASIRREQFLKSHGAALVVDYKAKDLSAQIEKFLDGKPLTKALDTISTVESSYQVMSFMASNAEVAYVLPDAALARRSDVRSEFVLCGMFHDNSKENPAHRKYGAEVIWPLIGDLMKSKVYPLQPQLVLDGNLDNLVDRVTRGFGIVRDAAGDGKKIVVTWPQETTK